MGMPVWSKMSPHPVILSEEGRVGVSERISNYEKHGPVPSVPHFEILSSRSAARGKPLGLRRLRMTGRQRGSFKEKAWL